MGMTVVITRNVAARFRGFLASCMLEIASGVYTAPRLNRAVRERIWTVMTSWFDETDAIVRGEGLPSIIMTWRDPRAPGGQCIQVLGIPPRELVELDGHVLARTRFEASDPPSPGPPVAPAHIASSLTTE